MIIEWGRKVACFSCQTREIVTVKPRNYKESRQDTWVIGLGMAEMGKLEQPSDDGIAMLDDMAKKACCFVQPLGIIGLPQGTWTSKTAVSPRQSLLPSRTGVICINCAIS